MNKHLLPVYDKPMIFYPIDFLVENGIRDIIIVTDKRLSGDFLNLLGSGKDFGARFAYALQENAAGIADALKKTEFFCGTSESMTVILGDNILLGTLDFNLLEFDKGARVFLKEVRDPERFGVAYLDKFGNITDIVEKPKNNSSHYAVTGIYQYDSDVFDIIDSLRPSNRNELEISDVNKVYLERGLLTHRILRNPWIDAGTIDSLYQAQSFVRNYRKRKS